MESLFVITQIILAILIALIVLVNITNGSEYGVVFRGAEAIFGGEGPGSFLNKVTMILVVLFFLNSLILTKIYVNKTKSPLLRAPTVKKEKKVKPSGENIPTPPKGLPVIPQ